MNNLFTIHELSDHRQGSGIGADTLLALAVSLKKIEGLIVGSFVSADILSRMVIPGLLVIGNQNLNHRGASGEDMVQQGK